MGWHNALYLLRLSGLLCARQDRPFRDDLYCMIAGCATGSPTLLLTSAHICRSVVHSLYSTIGRPVFYVTDETIACMGPWGIPLEEREPLFYELG
jgi:hypothetical protein